MFRQCALCERCAGHGYQSPPVLGVGDPAAPILVIAQNPGEIRADDKIRLERAENARKAEWLLRGNEEIGVDDADIVGELEWWYRWDFETSYANTRFSEIFGTEWLDSGVYYYTNAVRCRTPRNERPSDEMVTNCREAFTLPLMSDRRAIVFVGGLSKVQTLGPLGMAMKVGAIHRHKVFGLMVAIPHYRVWGRGDAMRYRHSITRLLRRVENAKAS